MHCVEVLQRAKMLKCLEAHIACFASKIRFFLVIIIHFFTYLSHDFWLGQSKVFQWKPIGWNKIRLKLKYHIKTKQNKTKQKTKKQKQKTRNKKQNKQKTTTTRLLKE